MQGFCCPVDVHLQRRNRAGDAGCAVATWLLLAENAVSEVVWQLRASRVSRAAVGPAVGEIASTGYVKIHTGRIWRKCAKDDAFLGSDNERLPWFEAIVLECWACTPSEGVLGGGTGT